MLSKQLRACCGSVLSVLLLLVGAVAASAGAPPASTPGHLSLAAAQAYAPSAQIISASTPLPSDGKFIVQQGSGYEVVERSTRLIATTAAGSRCVFGTITRLDGGGVVLWMGANLCWNGRVAWANGVQTTCTAILPYFACLYHQSGTFGNNTRLAGAWGNFYSSAGPFPMGTGLRLDIQPNGNWWGWSYDCGRVC